MRPSLRASAVLTLWASIVAAIAGCWYGPVEYVGPPEPTVTPTPSPTASDDPGRLGGADTGFSIERPDGWAAIDPDGDLLDDMSAELPDELAEIFPEMVGMISDMGGFFAVDIRSISRLGGEFAANLNGYCVDGLGGLDLTTLAELGREQSEALGVTDFVWSETTIGTVEALRVTYKMQVGSQQAQGVQFVFHGAEGQPCYLTFSTAPDDEDLDRFDAIAGTVQLSDG